MKKEDLLKFYQKYSLYIFPAVVVLSSLVLIIFVIYPQLVKFISNQKTGKEFQNKSKFLEVKAQALESLDLDQLTSQVNYAVGSYPTDRDTINAMTLFQKLTSQLGFNIVSMNLASANIKNEKAQQFSFKAELIGPSALIPTLLSNIENSPRLMRVNGIEITSAGVSQAANIAIGVDFLYAAAPAGFGSVDSPLPEISEKDEEIIARLAKQGIPATPQIQTPAQLGPRGKANPFE